jgi:hypothetical protein
MGDIYPLFFITSPNIHNYYNKYHDDIKAGDFVFKHRDKPKGIRNTLSAPSIIVTIHHA